MEQLTAGGSSRSPEEIKVTASPARRRYSSAATSTSQHRASLHLCASLQLVAGAGFVSVHLDRSERREEERRSNGKAETNHTSSDESHLDCSEAEALPG